MLPIVELTGSYHRDPLGFFFLTHTVEIMTVIFLAFIFLLAINFKTILKNFSKVKINTWLLLLLIFLVGFWLRNSEYRYGWGLDGFVYLETARTLYEKNFYAKACAIGNLDFCRLYHQHLFLQGYSYLIYLSFLLFGQHDLFAMYLSGILNSLTIILIFCITYLLFSNERKGLYAALAFALIPLDIFIAPTGASRPTSLFFISLAILFYLIALKKDTLKLWSLVAIALSYAIYVRQENYILFVPMLLGLFLFNYFKKEQFKNLRTIRETLSKLLKKFYLPGLIFLLTQFMALHWILFGNVGFSFGLPLFSFEYFKVIAPLMLKMLFFKDIFTRTLFYNPLVSILSFSTIFLLFKKKFRSKLLFVWVWFLSFFVLMASYYFQGFPNSLPGDFIRYMQSIHIPYAILAGFALSFIEEKIKFRNIVFIVIFIILLISTPIQSKFSLFKDGRLNEPYTNPLTRSVNITPENSLIFISQCPIPNFDLVRTKERRWIDIDMIFANKGVWAKEEIEDNKSKPILFIEDYRCMGSEDEACKFIYENFKLQPIANFTYEGTRAIVYNATYLDKN